MDTINVLSGGNLRQHVHSYLIDADHSVFNNAVDDPHVAILQPMQTRAFILSTQLPSEPLIPGTTIPVFRIAALLDGGLSVSEVMEDFPSLAREQIQFARRYAQKNPNLWQKYPPVSLKRLLRNSGFAEAQRALGTPHSE